MFRRLLRLANPEIAFGFVLATVFWIGVLGWQAAYAPSEMEKKKCHEAAEKSGHKTEECKSLWERTTSDPVAFFTFWLVVSTVGLGVSTVLLWYAGEKQLRHARRSAAIQSRDMRASIETANRAAKAAEDSVLISRQVGESQVRAYLFCEEATYAIVDDVLVVEVKVRNQGQSPAIWSEIRAESFNVRIGYVKSFVYAVKFTFAGPTITAGQIGVMAIVLPINQLRQADYDALLKHGVTGFDLRGRICWRDVFGKSHSQSFASSSAKPKGATPSPVFEREGRLIFFNRAQEQAEGGSKT
jgi:hypothetical protein